MSAPARTTGVATPALVGHRGAAALAPENTVASFRRGIAEGAELLECDVHLSRDGVDAIIHDATLDRTAQEESPLHTGAVADLTRAQLDRVLVGHGEHIPTLTEVLDVAVREDGTRVTLLVEIKAPAAAERVVRILSEYFDQDCWDQPSAPAQIISFHPDALRAARSTDPRIPRLLTTTTTSPEFFETAQEVGVVQIGVRIADARQADVERARELGIRLNLWTARSEEELSRALELGCDTLTVDDPAWARALMEGPTRT
ncbi:glycerophosphodiester phosphodiesterase [Brachybacterium sp. P6-10-X1]|uniref:glycerophosphodiester phosphodiesterase n=1 Tax=Brachybacterium sp. P6-10-X1 TaxID=1903186 RepID=UPI000971AF99|nr:glycerophosphodiester phosphodiesterase [Brachybacterium sp. P6-10-X1]APX33414.1 glycerophosphodiester phosphodiesterase [Brachybacterium sp. P6-10-X1]